MEELSETRGQRGYNLAKKPNATTEPQTGDAEEKGDESSLPNLQKVWTFENKSRSDCPPERRGSVVIDSGWTAESGTLDKPEPEEEVSAESDAITGTENRRRDRSKTTRWKSRNSWRGGRHKSGCFRHDCINKKKTQENTVNINRINSNKAPNVTLNNNLLENKVKTKRPLVFVRAETQRSGKRPKARRLRKRGNKPNPARVR